MFAFRVEMPYVPEYEAEPNKDLCYLAREILSAYMETPCPFEKEEGDDSWDLCEGSQDAAVHQTTPVRINGAHRALLTNMPYLHNENGDLVAWTEPGYVCLIAELIEEDKSEDDDDEVEFKHDAQIVFRLPRPKGDPAAIFIGTSLEDTSQVAEDDVTKQRKIKRVLECVRLGLRALAETDEESWEEMFQNQAPRLATGDLIEIGLREFFGGND